MLTGLPLRAIGLAVLLLPTLITTLPGHAQDSGAPEGAALRLFVIEQQSYAGRMAELAAALQALVPASGEQLRGKHIAINANGEARPNELFGAVDDWISSVAQERRISRHTPKPSVANLRRRISAQLNTLNNAAVYATNDADRTAEVHLFLSDVTFTITDDDRRYSLHNIGDTGFSDGCFNRLSQNNGRIKMTNLIVRVFVYPPDGRKLGDETMRSIARSLDIDPSGSNTAQLLLGQGNMSCPQPNKITTYEGQSFDQSVLQCESFNLRAISSPALIDCPPDPEPTPEQRLAAQAERAAAAAAEQARLQEAAEQARRAEIQQAQIEENRRAQAQARDEAQAQRAKEAQRLADIVRNQPENRPAEPPIIPATAPIPQDRPQPQPRPQTDETWQEAALPQDSDIRETDRPTLPSDSLSQHIIRRGYVLSQPMMDQATRNRLKSMAILIELEQADTDAQIYAAFSPNPIGTVNDGLKIAAPAGPLDLKLSRTKRISDRMRGRLRYYFATPCTEGRTVSAAIRFHGHPAGQTTPAISRRITIEQTLVSCPGSQPVLIPFGMELKR